MDSEASELLQWKEEIGILKKKTQAIPIDKQDFTAFYGSSSIRLWTQMNQDLYPHDVVNLGFGGSSYFWCNYFFDEIFEGIQPSRIILYAGDNDLGSGVPKIEILKNLKSILNKIKNLNESAIVAVISVKPSPERSYLRSRIEELNTAIKDLMSETGNHFIDIYPSMLDSSGNHRPELFLEDLLHMNELGYEIWKEEIGNYLDRIT